VLGRIGRQLVRTALTGFDVIEWACLLDDLTAHGDVRSVDDTEHMGWTNAGYG